MGVFRRDFTVNDPRGQLVLSEAITFAIEGMSRLPEEHRPKRDIEDMKALLSDAALPNLAHFQSEARRRVDVLLGIAPRAMRGWVLVHNHVRYKRPGFRMWYEPLAAYHIACDCGWMPQSGPHYRVGRP